MMQEMFGTSYLFGSNAPFIEELYDAYLADPASVDGTWRQYFDALQRTGNGPPALAITCRFAPPGNRAPDLHADIVPSLTPNRSANSATGPGNFSVNSTAPFVRMHQSCHSGNSRASVIAQQSCQALPPHRFPHWAPNQGVGFYGIVTV